MVRTSFGVSDTLVLLVVADLIELVSTARNEGELERTESVTFVADLELSFCFSARRFNLTLRLCSPHDNRSDDVDAGSDGNSRCLFFFRRFSARTAPSEAVVSPPAMVALSVQI